MVFYDYKGRSYTASVYGNDTSKIFPLSTYDFPNNQIYASFLYRASLFGYVDLFINTVNKTVNKNQLCNIYT